MFYKSKLVTLSAVVFLCLVRPSMELECYTCEEVPNSNTCNGFSNSAISKCYPSSNICSKTVTNAGADFETILRRCDTQQSCDGVNNAPANVKHCYSCTGDRCNSTALSTPISFALISLISSLNFLLFKH